MSARQTRPHPASPSRPGRGPVSLTGPGPGRDPGGDGDSAGRLLPAQLPGDRRPSSAPTGRAKSSLFRSILGQVPYTGHHQVPAGRRLPQPTPRSATSPRAPASTGAAPVQRLRLLRRRHQPLAGVPARLPPPCGTGWPDCLSRVHGEALLHKRIGTLSGGELQRVLHGPGPGASAPNSDPGRATLRGGRGRRAPAAWTCWMRFRQTYDLSILSLHPRLLHPAAVRRQGDPAQQHHSARPAPPPRSSPPRSFARCFTWTSACIPMGKEGLHNEHSGTGSCPGSAPFEWAAPDTMLFMKNALAGGPGRHRPSSACSPPWWSRAAWPSSPTPWATPPLPAWPSALCAA